jgi:hypothetical protein
MGKLFESAFGLALIAIGLVAYFPGGTILMAARCDHDRLDGLDWVLSVVVPFFGVLKTIFSSDC